MRLAHEQDAGSFFRAAMTMMTFVAGCGPPPPVTFHPAPGTTWQWQLTGLPVDRSVDVAVYDVDLFDVPAEEIAALHDEERQVICYLSAGTYETFREDADRFPDDVKGAAYDEEAFAEERYLDIRAGAVRDILKSRLDLAVEKGCDAVEPDNVDLHDHETGFDITAEENLEFNLFLSAEAHARGLSVGLKNNLSQLGSLVEAFDWALNESCFSFDECDSYVATFLASRKAVFHAEYVEFSRVAEVCAATAPLGISSIVKNLDLDAPVALCP